jgi:hypothetical protein
VDRATTQSAPGGISLFAVFAYPLPHFRIDEMNQSTHEAGDAHKGIVGSFGLIVVWSPALHTVTCRAAAVDEWRHRAS